MGRVSGEGWVSAGPMGFGQIGWAIENRLVDWSVGCLVCVLAGWLVGRLAGWSVGSSTRRSVGWLVGWSALWLLVGSSLVAWTSAHQRREFAANSRRRCAEVLRRGPVKHVIYSCGGQNSLVGCVVWVGVERAGGGGGGRVSTSWT